MVNCLVKCCTSRSDKKATEKVGFFSIPKVILKQCEKTKALSLKRRLAWLKAINRPDLFNKEGRYFKVCGRHFITGKSSALFDVASPDWSPTLELGEKQYGARKNPISAALRHERATQRAKRKLKAVYPTQPDYTTLQSEDSASLNNSNFSTESNYLISIKEEPQDYQGSLEYSENSTSQFDTNSNVSMEIQIPLSIKEEAASEDQDISDDSEDVDVTSVQNAAKEEHTAYQDCVVVDEDGDQPSFSTSVEAEPLSDICSQCSLSNTKYFSLEQECIRLRKEVHDLKYKIKNVKHKYKEAKRKSVS